MKVLVTGAGRAIGAATCHELKAAGHEVIATARDVSLLQELDVDQRLQLDVTSCLLYTSGRAIDEGVFVRMIKGPTPDGSSRDEPTLASIGPGDDRFCLFDD